MDYLPIYLDLRDRKCLVVGGGEVAERKVKLLIRAGARVRVVSPALRPNLSALLEGKELDYRQGEFEPVDLDGCHLAVAATNDLAVNRQVSELAKAQRIPVNVVNDTGLCTFVTPSIIDRSPVLVAVSTGGAAPMLARQLRARLETLVPSAYGRLASLAGSLRGEVQRRIDSPAERRRFWEKVFQGPVAELVFSGHEKTARRLLREKLASDRPGGPCKGEVYLVGGGPGDPDLLTFRALRLIQRSDVIVYDRLVSQAIVDLAPPDARRIYVGKQRDNHALPQESINELLARLARDGHRVCRLKGGDPFIFGRGGEEIQTLADQGVPFQVVPGITAASGSASYAGIPLTHRDYSQACLFVTGHLKDGSMDLNWEMLAQPNQTVVVYMGLLGLAILCQRLIEHGVSPDMPAALVQQATTPQQRVLTGTLATLDQIAARARPKPPTLIIVGDVVKLHEKLAWFEPLPSEDDEQEKDPASAAGED